MVAARDGRLVQSRTEAAAGNACLAVLSVSHVTYGVLVRISIAVSADSGIKVTVGKRMATLTRLISRLSF